MTTDVLRSGLRVGGQKDLQIIWDTLTVYGTPHLMYKRYIPAI